MLVLGADGTVASTGSASIPRERGVRRFEKLLDGHGVALNRRNASAQGHSDLFDTACHVESALGQRAADVFHHRACEGGIGFGQQQAELRAIQSSGHVVRTCRLLE